MSNQKFNQYPLNAEKKEIEGAMLADTQTTLELVKDDEKDALYFRALESMGIKLNEPQLHAVRHYTDPALVLAGAGSGKTRVLASRAGYLISVHEINPKQILLLTFTRKAADEMKERISVLPGLTKRMVNDITSGTYHSIFLQILRSQGDNRRLLTSEKQKHTLLKIIMKEMGVVDDYEPESLLAILSHNKNNMVTVEEFSAKTSVEKEIKEILRKYEQQKKDNGWMDFDDILLDAFLLLKTDKRLLNTIQERFKFVLCDEWQDTNPVQYELIKMLALPQNNLFVVGDDDQTIFEFNGADASIILNFPTDYPNTKTFQLDINYRSTTSIVGLANKLISFNKARYKKTLKATQESEHRPYFFSPSSSDEEAAIIIENMKNEVERGDRNFKDFAILFRSNSYSRAMFDALVLKNIPFVTFGNKGTFYEQAIVKPVLDHLRLALNGKNLEAVNSILPTLYLNREKTFEFIQRRELTNPASNVLLHTLEMPYLKEFQKKQIFNRVRLLQEITKMEPVVAIRGIRVTYDKYLETDKGQNITIHKEMVKEMLAEIESSSARFKTISEFLSFVDGIISKNKQMEELRLDPKADVVKLMTIHKSKGLEFPVVYLIGASETILPHSSALEAEDKKDLIISSKGKNINEAAIEAERRLAYVAVTRAEEEIYISSPLEYRGQRVEPSRFIMNVFSGDKKEKTQQTLKINQWQTKASPSNTNRHVAETTIVWECTNASCQAWKRITSYEEMLHDQISCTVCGESMEKGVKEFY